MKDALATWTMEANKPRYVLTEPSFDWTALSWTEGDVPEARDQLEAALCALNRRQAAPLRAAVYRADAAFLSRTLNNPRADPARPWWWRRWQ